jgi:hypothetical protein
MSTYSDHDIAVCHTNQNTWKVVEVLCQKHLLYTGFYYLIIKKLASIRVL